MGKNDMILYLVFFTLLLVEFDGIVVPLNSITLSSSDIRHPIAFPHLYQHPRDSYEAVVVSYFSLKLF